MADKNVVNEADMQVFCERVGELILWTSEIDAQLTKAVIWACSLSESPMLEPIVAELDVRVKIEILRARSKHIKVDAWSKGIIKWGDKVEKVSGYRNIVAHQRVEVNDGKLTIHAGQARKLLKNIKGLKPVPAKTSDDVSKWVDAAKAAYKQGQNVLANLEKFSVESAKHSKK